MYSSTLSLTSVLDEGE